MKLTKGSRLGPYEITAVLGVGGMGEVYRARDTRLDRTIAIKVLPEEFSHSDDRRTRFLREAKAISALAHPHICTLHDIGREDGIDYLVMEYLEGETLSERLCKGPLPIAQALQYAIEIADALEKAHRSGIIHRDLKPGNIMLTKSGAKLLDFGLAKSIARPQNMVTAAVTEERLTAEGTLLGTIDFMAPETIERGEADERADIFAFGNILYRMISGRAPFGGNSDAAVLAAILHHEPPPINHASVPDVLERLVQWCLKKDPEERIQTAHDVKLQLQSIDLSERRPTGTTVSHLPWIAGGVAIAGAIAAILLLTHRPANEAAKPVARFSIELPTVSQGFEWANHDIAISPDGTKLVASLNIGNGRQLYLRSFDRPDIVALPNTADAFNPFFSPDGRFVGFAARGKLKKLLLGGDGEPVTICDAPRNRGGTWGADDTIVFAPVSSGQGLFRVSASGGPPRVLTRLDARRKENSHRWPAFLPDGKHVVFSIDDWGADYTRKRIAVVEVDGGPSKIILEGATDARYVEPGYLIFGRERSLYAIRFDARRLEVSGLPAMVINGVTMHAGMGSVTADVSRDGTLVYLPYDAAAGARELVWVDRQGNAQPLSDVRREYFNPALSPDGRQLLVGAGESKATDLWLLNIANNSWSRIAPEGKSLAAIWSHDGNRIFVTSNRNGRYNVFEIEADGSGPARQITNKNDWPSADSISPDDRVLLIEEQNPVTSDDLWSVTTDGRQSTPLVTTRFNEASADFSPDGRSFAYMSNESGPYEIYVQRFPLTGRKWLVSDDGGALPRWSSDGRELFFRNGRKMMVTKVTPGPVPSFSKPEMLFEANYAQGYDVTSDGQRFVMLREYPRDSVRLAVVLGWSKELDQRFSAQQKR